MVSGKDQHIVRVIQLHISEVLIDGIGRARVPFAVAALLIRRKHSYPADILVQIPRNTYSDMRVQPKRLILSKNAHRIHTRVNTVAQREINDAVFPAKRNGRFCHL